MLTNIRKVLKLLTTRERKRLYMLLGAMTVSALISVVGIASILPFLSLITNQALIQDNKFLNWFYLILNFQSANKFLIFTGAVVLFVLIVSNLLTFLTDWGLFRFSWARDFTMSKRLLERYLYQPYVFFLNQNTSELGKNILTEVQQTVKGVVIPLMQICSNGIVAFLIFTMLVAVEPLLAISVMVIIGGGYAIIYVIIKKKLNKTGKQRFRANAERFKAVDEAFGGIKQLKLLGCEEVFIKRYSKPCSDYVRHNATNQIISEIPRYIMEIFAFGGMIIVVIFLLATDRGFQEVLPLMGFFAFAAYRLMPALQKIFTSIASIRFNTASLNALYQDMYSFNNQLSQTTSCRQKYPILHLQKDLTLKEITFSYPGTTIPVIDNLNIKIDTNTSVAFVGVTGTGKTTIVDIILGLLRPDSGNILVDGLEITDENLPSWQKNLGYIPQDIFLQDDTVTRNIAYGVHYEDIDMEAVERAASIANIHDFVMEGLPNGYQTIVGERGVRLSGGQRQRIGIARALYHDPEVLVLDEATSALDGATEKAVFAAIQNIAKTKTFVIIAHRLTTVKNCDVIYVLEEGKIVGQGKYEELMKSNKVFRKMVKAHL